MSNNSWGFNATNIQVIIIWIIVFMIVWFLLWFIRVYIMMSYNWMNQKIWYSRDKIEYIYSRFNDLDLKCNK